MLKYIILTMLLASCNSPKYNKTEHVVVTDKKITKQVKMVIIPYTHFITIIQFLVCFDLYGERKCIDDKESYNKYKIGDKLTLTFE